MKPHFLFPVSMNSRVIDEVFQDQAIALKQAGFNTSVISFATETIHAKPNFTEDEVVVYRGWMLSEKEYDVLLDQIDLMGGKPLVSKEQYLLTHHLPNWYESLRGITPETRFMSGLEDFEGIPVEAICAEINAMGFQRVFLKDFVKSLKTGEKPIFECPVKVEDLQRTIEAMIKYRGQIEGGLVIREYEEFVPNSEMRYFIINGYLYGPDDRDSSTRVTALLARLARDVQSPFFSVDIALRIDGHFRVIELGDGQVSDLVDWTYQRFANVWREAVLR